MHTGVEDRLVADLAVRVAAVALVTVVGALAGCSGSATPMSSPEVPQASAHAATLQAMPTFRLVGGPHVVRTDYHDDGAWAAIRSQVLQETSDGFRANVDIVEDATLADLGTDSVLAALPPDYQHGFLVIVDHDSITLPDHPVLVLDLQDPAHGRFRALPSTVQQIENNLSIANMDFAEFAQSVDSTGVFRGF